MTWMASSRGRILPHRLEWSNFYQRGGFSFWRHPFLRSPDWAVSWGLASPAKPQFILLWVNAASAPGTQAGKKSFVKKSFQWSACLVVVVVGSDMQTTWSVVQTDVLCETSAWESIAYMTQNCCSTLKNLHFDFCWWFQWFLHQYRHDLYRLICAFASLQTLVYTLNLCIFCQNLCLEPCKWQRRSSLKAEDMGVAVVFDSNVPLELVGECGKQTGNKKQIRNMHVKYPIMLMMFFWEMLWSGYVMRRGNALAKSVRHVCRTRAGSSHS